MFRLCPYICEYSRMIAFYFLFNRTLTKYFMSRCFIPYSKDIFLEVHLPWMIEWYDWSQIKVLHFNRAIFAVDQTRIIYDCIVFKWTSEDQVERSLLFAACDSKFLIESSIVFEFTCFSICCILAHEPLLRLIMTLTCRNAQILPAI